jgi:hypothetical protein
MLRGRYQQGRFFRNCLRHYPDLTRRADRSHSGLSFTIQDPVCLLSRPHWAKLTRRGSSARVPAACSSTPPGRLRPRRAPIASRNVPERKGRWAQGRRSEADGGQLTGGHFDILGRTKSSHSRNPPNPNMKAPGINCLSITGQTPMSEPAIQATASQRRYPPPKRSTAENSTNKKRLRVIVDATLYNVGIRARPIPSSDGYLRSGRHLRSSRLRRLLPARSLNAAQVRPSRRLSARSRFASARSLVQRS